MYLTGLIFNEHKQLIRNNVIVILCAIYIAQNKEKKVQVGKYQEKAQSEKDSHSKNRDGKKLNKQSSTYTMKTYRKPIG